MRRNVLAMLMMACAAPGFAANEAPVSEYLDDPSIRTPLLTSPTTIAANGILDQFFAQMQLAFTAQTSIAPFRARSQSQAVQTAGVFSTSSQDRVNRQPSPVERVEYEVTREPTSVEIGSSLDTPWEAWENREDAVTDEYRDLDR